MCLSAVQCISVSAFNVRMSLICMITWITYQETPTKTPTIAKNAINFIFAFSEGKNRDYSKPKLNLAFRFFFSDLNELKLLIVFRCLATSLLINIRRRKKSRRAMIESDCSR